MKDAINWRSISDRITTSGQPTEEQLLQLKTMGVTTIINLGPHSNDGALDDETASIAKLGLRYIYIPVDFEAPTNEDFAQFKDALEDVRDEKIHVHCIYNARVSAFFYRLAKDTPQENEAFDNMESVWRPGGVWARFIGKEQDSNLPNRYKGDDYQ